MIKAPNPDNDTTRRFPRTLSEAFPSAPEWQDKPHLADRIIVYLGVLCCRVFTLLNNTRVLKIRCCMLRILGNATCNNPQDISSIHKSKKVDYDSPHRSDAR